MCYPWWVTSPLGSWLFNIQNEKFGWKVLPISVFLGFYSSKTLMETTICLRSKSACRLLLPCGPLVPVWSLERMTHSYIYTMLNIVIIITSSRCMKSTVNLAILLLFFPCRVVTINLWLSSQHRNQNPLLSWEYFFSGTFLTLF